MEEGRSAFKILTGKPTGKGTLGRPRRRWEDSIRKKKEIGIITRNWVDSAQDRGYWIALCECGTEPLVFISHGVSYYIINLIFFCKKALNFLRLLFNV